MTEDRQPAEAGLLQPPAGHIKQPHSLPFLKGLTGDLEELAQYLLVHTQLLPCPACQGGGLPETSVITQLMPGGAVGLGLSRGRWGEDFLPESDPGVKALYRALGRPLGWGARDQPATFTSALGLAHTTRCRLLVSLTLFSPRCLGRGLRGWGLSP